jgi:hypothetical protein
VHYLNENGEYEIKLNKEYTLSYNTEDEIKGSFNKSNNITVVEILFLVFFLICIIQIQSLYRG